MELQSAVSIAHTCSSSCKSLCFPHRHSRGLSREIRSCGVSVALQCSWFIPEWIRRVVPTSMSWQLQRKAAVWRVGTKDVSQLITWSVVQNYVMLYVILFLFPCSHLYYVLFKKNCLGLVGPLQKEVERGEQVRGEPHSLKCGEGKLPRGGAWRGWLVLETVEGTLNSRVSQELFHLQAQAMQKEGHVPELGIHWKKRT